MNRVMLWVCAAIMLLTLSVGDALGQTYYVDFGIGMDINWTTIGLTDNCTPSGTPLPDGRIIRIFWDENANGPDAADQPWPLSNCNFNQDTLNGAWSGCLDIPGTFHTWCRAQWVVLSAPAAPANRYYVKVYCEDGETPQYVSTVRPFAGWYWNGSYVQEDYFQFSDFSCVECGTFRVMLPNGGEVWRLGETATVQWQASGYDGQLKIELNRNYPGGVWEVLADSTVNDGTETVLVTGPSSGTCRVRVSSIPDTLTDVLDADFRIECAPTPIPFVDNFDGPELDSCWLWVREDTSHWSLTERPGWMRIKTQPGRIYYGLGQNYLLRSRPTGDFQA